MCKSLRLPIALLVFTASVTAFSLGQSPNATRSAVADVRPVNMVLNGNWKTILAASMKRPGNKDLFLDVTAECGLFTGNQMDPFADATVEVQVLVDGQAATPGPVSFCGKSNGFVSPFSMLANCSSSSLSSCGLTSSELNTIELSLRSHAFNFLYVNLPNGINSIVVQARVNEDSSVGPAYGVIGKGSLEVTAQNLKNNPVGP
ncbi:MAG: hypothetical protein NVSMB58_33990 [Terriglobales bacterium]